MRLLKRTLIVLPMAIALTLTLLIQLDVRLGSRRQQIAGYAFLFGTPWASLLDRGWPWNPDNQLAEKIVAYAVILWIPALLYSSCVWLLFFVLGLRKRREIPRRIQD